MNRIVLCPDVKDVFYDNHVEYSKYFKPIVSIDLSIIDKKLDGKIFLVYYNDDPYCEATVDYLNEFCDGEKVTFDIVDGKYRFKTDFGYFLTNDDWKQWLEKGDKSYLDFLGKIKLDDIDPLDYIENLNGNPDWFQDDLTPLNSNGKKMKFICQLDSSDIIKDDCGKEIYLFYDYHDQVAVQVTQID